MKAAIIMLIGLVVLEVSYGQELLRPSTQEEKDPLRHPDGLTFVISERVGFNTFLGHLSPSLLREQNLNENIVSKMRELSQQRYRAQMQLLSELKKNWDGAAEPERAKIVSELVEGEDQLVKEQLEAFNELLVPKQQLALVNEFLRSGNPRLLFDPSIAMWLELNTQEIDKMRRCQADAQAFLQKGRALVPNRNQPLPQDMDAEYRRIREKMWKDLSEEKIVRCFQAFGFISADEGLVDFLRRFPERGVYLVEEVPAFAVAKLRLEADDKKTEKSGSTAR